MGAEVKKLGLDIGKKELNDWLFGSNPPQDLKQRFTDEQGQYNAAAAQDAMNQMRRSPNQKDKDQLNTYLAAMEYNRQAEKLADLNGQSSRDHLRRDAVSRSHHHRLSALPIASSKS